MGSGKPQVFIDEEGYQGTCMESRVKSWRAASHQSRENAAQAVFLPLY